MTTGDDVALTLIHTADWHLGKRFPGFAREDEEKLTRARLKVLDRVFGLADQYRADAVLCAGDLFDEPQPSREWWEPLAERLGRSPPSRPIFLLPGNHDPLRPGGIWDRAYGLRARLPEHVIVVDRRGFSHALSEEAILYANPCTSQAGQEDLALALPAREPGDRRIRIGLVHGSTFDLPGHETNFPIARDAAHRRGLDYLAIGDTHGFRRVPPDAVVPAIYPGAPEPTGFDEVDGGTVALVHITRSRRVHVEPKHVACWTWESRVVRSIEELRDLAARTDLTARVLRLHVEAALSPRDYEEAEHLLELLRGTDAVHPRVGILDLDRSGLLLDPAATEAAFDGFPEPLRVAAERLRASEGTASPAVVSRAIYNLYRLAKRVA